MENLDINEKEGMCSGGLYLLGSNKLLQGKR